MKIDSTKIQRASSPVLKSRRDRDSSNIRESKALSSIQKSSDVSDDVRDRSDLVRYGSVGVSDGDLLKTLTGISGGKDQVSVGLDISPDPSNQSSLHTSDSSYYRPRAKGPIKSSYRSSDDENEQLDSDLADNKRYTEDNKSDDDEYSFKEFDEDYEDKLQPKADSDFQDKFPKSAIDYFEIERLKSIDAIWSRWSSLDQLQDSLNPAQAVNNATETAENIKQPLSTYSQDDENDYNDDYQDDALSKGIIVIDENVDQKKKADEKEADATYATHSPNEEEYTSYDDDFIDYDTHAVSGEDVIVESIVKNESIQAESPSTSEAWKPAYSGHAITDPDSPEGNHEDYIKSSTTDKEAEEGIVLLDQHPLPCFDGNNVVVTSEEDVASTGDSSSPFELGTEAAPAALQPASNYTLTSFDDQLPKYLKRNTYPDAISLKGSDDLLSLQYEKKESSAPTSRAFNSNIFELLGESWPSRAHKEPGDHPKSSSLKKKIAASTLNKSRRLENKVSMKVDENNIDTKRNQLNALKSKLRRQLSLGSNNKMIEINEENKKNYVEMNRLQCRRSPANRQPQDATADRQKPRSFIPTRNKRNKTTQDSTKTDDKHTLNEIDMMWQEEAVKTMKHLLDENEQLVKTKFQLKEKEEYLKKRETLLFRSIRDVEVSHEAIAISRPLDDKVDVDTVADSNLKEQVKATEKKVEDLMKEMDGLKSRLYALNEENNCLKDQLESISNGDKDRDINGSRIRTRHVTGILVPASAQALASNSISTNPTFSPVPAEDQVIISRKEFEDLIHERDTQEGLIIAYQKENQQCMQLLKKKDIEDKQQKAHFFDQQESLNKELNRLRNLMPLDSKENASKLRVDIDYDMNIRHLQERLATVEANAGLREKKLLNTIENLKKDYKQLVDRSSDESNQLWKDMKSQLDGLQETITIKNRDIEDLKIKLSWYAENQMIIDEMNDEKKSYEKQLKALREEFGAKHGPSKNFERDRRIGGPKTATGAASIHEEANGVDEHSAKATNRTFPSRHPADVRKIKELEEAVHELQSAINKRFPDSVSSLIHAATHSDAAKQKIIEQYQTTIEQLTSELAFAKEDFQLKLRSLRQEHERIRQKYDSLLLHVQNEKKSVDVHRSQHVSSKPTSLVQAMQRIKELEGDNEKIRNFYTKKIDDIQRKAEAQMIALKKAGHHVPMEAATSAMQATALEVEASLKQQYEQRLDVLEKELISTAEELGRVKKEKLLLYEQVRKESLVSKEASETDADAKDNSSVDKTVSLQEHERMKKLLENQLKKECDNYSRLIDELKDEKTKSTQELREKEEEWTAEKMKLFSQLKDEESRSSQLATELRYLKLQLESHAKTPLSSQFQLMESHISQLEMRLANRERELKNSLEESRSTSRLELVRLQAIHEQETREKDEQMARFQSQLEYLVATLRHLQE